MSTTSPSGDRPKAVTDVKIPGTQVPDVNEAAGESERAKAWMSKVAVSTAIMAAIAAISGSTGTGHLNQAMFHQIREADQWSHYQAKSVKQAIVEGRVEGSEGSGQPAREADKARIARYADEMATIKTEAEKCRATSEDHMHRYGRMSRAATIAQIGIALGAVAILTKRNAFWACALVAGVIGAAFMTMGFLGM